VSGRQEEYAALHEKYQAIKAQRMNELESMLSEQTKQVPFPFHRGCSKVLHQALAVQNTMFLRYWQAPLVPS